MKQLIKLTIPFPPTTGNHTSKARRGGGWFTDPAVTRYRSQVATIAAQQNAKADLQDLLSVAVLIWAPDKRKRDLTNIWKVSEDAITKARVWRDDSLINTLAFTEVGVDRENPRLEVYVSTLENACTSLRAFYLAVKGPLTTDRG